MATKSIGLTGRDYSTLAAWASYVNALSLSANEIGEVYNDGELVETAAVTIGGWTANGFSVTLRPAAGQGFKDHASVATNPLRYNASVGAAIRSTYSSVSATPRAITFSGTNLSVRGLQFCVEQPNTNAFSFINTSSSASFLDSIFWVRRGRDLFNLSAGTTMRNCLLYATTFEPGVAALGLNGTGITLEANTIAQVESNTGAGLSIPYNSFLPTLKNNVIFGFTNDITNTVNAASTNNATSRSTIGGTNAGTNAQVNVSAADFVSVTSGSENFRTASGSAKLVGTGATLGAVTTDILGNSRSALYSIGAFQAPPAAAAPTVSTQPSNQSKLEGQTATFTASFAGYPTPTYQWQRSTNGGSTWANVSGGAGATTTSYTTDPVSVTGGAANNGDQYRCVATNASGSATTAAAVLTVGPATDTTPPTLTGAVTITGISSSGATAAWPAGTDNVAVTSYETSLDGLTWTDRGTALSYTYFGLSPSTAYTVRVRAKDAVGNVSATITGTFTTSAAAATGSITSSPLKNNTGTLLANVALDAYVSVVSTGALVVKRSGLSTNAAGVASFSDALLAAGTAYRVVWRLTASGAEGLETITAV